MIYYIDDFMTKMVKAHNTVTSDQRKAINMVKNVIETFQPKDEDILFLLKSLFRTPDTFPLLKSPDHTPP